MIARSTQRRTVPTPGVHVQKQEPPHRIEFVSFGNHRTPSFPLPSPSLRFVSTYRRPGRVLCAAIEAALVVRLALCLLEHRRHLRLGGVLGVRHFSCFLCRGSGLNGL